MSILVKVIPLVFSLLLAGAVYAQQPKLIIPTGHADDILTIDFSPDSKYILTTSQDQTAGLWETASGKLLFSIPAQSTPFTDAKFSHNGKMILTVEEVDSTVKQGLSSNTNKVSAVKIWDARTGNLNKQLKLGFKANKIDFSKDDNQLLVKWYGNLSVYNIASLRSVYELQAATVTISPSEKYILSIPPYGNKPNGIATISGASTGTVFKRGNAFKTFKLEEYATHLSFSNNDKYILAEHLIDLVDSIIVYEAASGKLLYRLPGFDDWEIPAVFSPRSNYILTVHDSVSTWNAANGKLLHSLKKGKGFNSASFSSDDKYIVTEDDSTAVEIWDAATGNLVHLLQPKNQSYYAYQELRFSADNKYVIAINRDFMKTKIWEVATRRLIYDSDQENVNTTVRKQMEFVSVCISSSPNGRYIAVTKYDKGKLWDTRSNNFINLQAVANTPHKSSFSPDGKYLATIYTDSTVNVWDVSSGKILYRIKEDLVTSTALSIDGKMATISEKDSMIRVWRLTDGGLLYALKSQRKFHSVNFNVDGKKIITAEYQTIKIWQAATGELEKEIPTPAVRLDGQFAGMSPDGSSIVTSSGTVWDVATGKESRHIPADTNINIRGYHSKQNWDFFPRGNTCFSPDGKFLAAVHSRNSYKGGLEGIGIVDISTGHVNYLVDKSYYFSRAPHAIDIRYSPDGSHISVVCSDATIKTWNILTGGQTSLSLSHPYNDATLSPDLKYLVTASADHTAKIIDVTNGKLLYTFITMDSTDYVVTDTTGRYDGTGAGRKAIYYVCDNEIIELEQLKAIIWQPNLASLIMKRDTGSFHSKSLSEANLCGCTPLVEQQGLKDGRYYFTITARNCGLGEIYLYVGGQQIRTYQPASLQKNGNNYQLIVDPKDIAEHFLTTGEENTITVKATTERNKLVSKDQKVSVKGKVDSVSANAKFYCISVGISEYKGDALKLHYASKDAADFEQVISIASRNLLGGGDENHVTSYVFNTEPASPERWPLKTNIRKAFDAIAKAATANDILLVFLSGHGVLRNEQFYYLTQQAAAMELAGVEKEVAISSEELSEWLRKIKAQKQVLILDACNSGQALQNLGISKDIPADQQRALEKLKDQTGTYMLSASASGQSAFEMSLYGRGALAYSLLLGLKTGEALNGQYVDIGKWFQFAADNAKEMAKDIAGRQEPQISIKGTFPIGKVDQQLRDQIKLAGKKPQFKRSNFQNDSLFIDNLKIAQALDIALNELTYKGEDRPLVFFAEATGEAVYSINGRYATNGNNIEAVVRLFQGTKPVLTIPVTAPIDNMNVLVKQVIESIIQKINQP